MHEASVQPEPGRVCQAPGCGTPLERKRRPSGALEPPSAFCRREFCDRRCAARGQHAAGRTASPWRNGPTVVGMARKGAPPRTIAPRDPAAPQAAKDKRNYDEFLAALERETEASWRREPFRKPWGLSSQRRNEEIAR